MCLGNSLKVIPLRLRFLTLLVPKLIKSYILKPFCFQSSKSLGRGFFVVRIGLLLSLNLFLLLQHDFTMYLKNIPDRCPKNFYLPKSPHQSELQRNGTRYQITSNNNTISNASFIIFQQNATVLVLSKLKE